MEQLQEKIVRLENKCTENSEEIRKLKSPKELRKENVSLKTTNDSQDFLRWLSPRVIYCHILWDLTSFIIFIYYIKEDFGSGRTIIR